MLDHLCLTVLRRVVNMVPASSTILYTIIGGTKVRSQTITVYGIPAEVISGGGRGYSFVLWIIFGTIYAGYASAWDLLMDWSVLRPRARYRFLRNDILYNNYVAVSPIFTAMRVNYANRYLAILRRHSTYAELQYFLSYSLRTGHQPSHPLHLGDLHPEARP